LNLASKSQTLKSIKILRNPKFGFHNFLMFFVTTKSEEYYY